MFSQIKENILNIFFILLLGSCPRGGTWGCWGSKTLAWGFAMVPHRLRILVLYCDMRSPDPVLCEQQRRRPAFASALSDQRLCYWCFIQTFNIICLCSWGGWLESHPGVTIKMGRVCQLDPETLLKWEGQKIFTTAVEKQCICLTFGLIRVCSF